MSSTVRPVSYPTDTEGRETDYSLPSRFETGVYRHDPYRGEVFGHMYNLKKISLHVSNDLIHKPG
jgi:hypothetical protein